MHSYRLEFTTRELALLRQTLHAWWMKTDLENESEQTGFASMLLADIDSVLAFDERHIDADYADLPERARAQCRAYGCTTSSIANGYCANHGSNRPRTADDA